MSESAPRGDIFPPAPIFDATKYYPLSRHYTTGYGLSEANYRGEQVLIHNVGSFGQVLDLHSQNLAEKPHVRTKRDEEVVALLDAGLSDAIEGLKELYPDIYSYTFWLIEQERKLQQAVVATQQRDDGFVYQQAWLEWRRKYVESGEKKVALSLFFDILAPEIDSLRLTCEDAEGYEVPVTPSFFCG